MKRFQFIIRLYMLGITYTRGNSFTHYTVRAIRRIRPRSPETCHRGSHWRHILPSCTGTVRTDILRESGLQSPSAADEPACRTIHPSLPPLICSETSPSMSFAGLLQNFANRCDVVLIFCTIDRHISPYVNTKHLAKYH